MNGCEVAASKLNGVPEKVITKTDGKKWTDLSPFLPVGFCLKKIINSCLRMAYFATKSCFVTYSFEMSVNTFINSLFASIGKFG
jgi:hypothetical protein